MNPSYTNATDTGGDTRILTPMDVERLLNDDSPDSRTDILEKISTNYNNEQFRGRERDIAEQIFRLLMKDVALRVRETLADRIKDNVAIPRDIVLHLAHDVESVASPVLVNSKVLSFVRQDERSKVFAVINFTDQPQQVTLHEELYPGTYVEHFSGERVTLEAETTLDLAAWAYRVYVRP